MIITTINGYKIRYLKYVGNSHLNGGDKSKQNLILLHGLGASAERWLKVAPLFAANFNVFIPDIIGFGYSDKPSIEYSKDLFIDFLYRYIEKEKIDNPILTGSSFGGFLALEFTFEFKEMVQFLILVSPAGAMKRSTPALDSYIMAALYPTFDNTLRAFKTMSSPISITDDTILDFINRMKFPNAKYAFMSTLNCIHNSDINKTKLLRVKTPTLIIWGKEDSIIPLDYIKHYIKFPNKKIKILKDTGHLPFIEKPTDFYNIVRAFLIDKGSINNI